VLGCGRAARVVLRWLADAGQIQIGQVCNRSLVSAADAVGFIGQGAAVEQLTGVSTDDWLLLGLPDSALAKVAERFRSNNNTCPGLAFHLSGAVCSDVLDGVAATVASVHPARAFARPADALALMGSTWFTAEGQGRAVAELKQRFLAAGGHWQQIDPAAKVAYHAATVVASNYLVVLTGMARDLALSAGLNETAAATLLDDLQRGTLGNLQGSSAARSLTGPVERGDYETCQRLLDQVAKHQPGHEMLFRELGLATLRLAIVGRGPHASDAALETLFTSRSG